MLKSEKECKHPVEARESHHIATHTDSTVDILYVCTLCGADWLVGYSADDEGHGIQP